MIVALDFDGVIMDGINECMLVSWNVFNKKPLTDFNHRSLREVPNEFVSLFNRLRNYVRHDGHFIVPYYVNGIDVTDGRSFDFIYNNLPENIKSEFRSNFAKYRRKVKESFPEYWISLHDELIELKEIVDLGVDIRIVSGKDAESILFLLNNKNIDIDPDKIHGRTVEKDTILKSIKSESDQNNEQLIFIDDNLNNIIDAKASGVNSWWASWGFHTQDNINDAKRLSIKTLDKSELLTFIKISKENEVKV